MASFPHNVDLPPRKKPRFVDLELRLGPPGSYYSDSVEDDEELEELEEVSDARVDLEADPCLAGENLWKYLSQDVVDMILARISQEELARLRCVSKDWNSSVLSAGISAFRGELGISGPDWIVVLFDSTPKPNQMVDSASFDYYNWLIAFTPESGSNSRFRTFDLDFLPSCSGKKFAEQLCSFKLGNYRFKSSAGGLLCLQNKKLELVICNPFSRAYKILPRRNIQSLSSTAMFYNNASKNYTIFTWKAQFVRLVTYDSCSETSKVIETNTEEHNTLLNSKKIVAVSCTGYVIFVASYRDRRPGKLCIYNVAKLKWDKCIIDCPVSEIEGVVNCQERLFLLAKGNARSRRTVWELDLASKKWIEHKTFCCPGQNVKCAAIRNHIYIFSRMASNLIVYDILSHTWVTEAWPDYTGPCSSSRLDHSLGASVLSCEIHCLP